MFIYIAGPITHGDRPKNIHDAVMAASKIRKANPAHVPFIPHLYELWSLIDPQTYEFWMALDLAWLGHCTALVRLPGESPGADREVAFARAAGMPVFFGLDALIASDEFWSLP